MKVGGDACKWSPDAPAISQACRTRAAPAITSLYSPERARGRFVAENKTQITDVDPVEFIAAVEHPTRRADAEVLLDMMRRVTGCEPRMWGPSIVGFGRYHYRYESGRESEFMITGFSPRKANLVVYVLPGYYDIGDQLARLGKHRVGKSCLYINKLADVDLSVLEEIVTDAVARMRRDYRTSDA